MPRPVLRSIPRKPVGSNRGTRSRAEAAIELVRLEYERERLVTGLNVATRNMETLRENMRGVEQRISQMNALLIPGHAANAAQPRIAHQMKRKV